jgi:hypothetical protein
MHGPRTAFKSNKLTSWRRVLVAATVLIGIIALPSPAAADVGMPMIVLVWPGAWVLFLPVVALESVVAHRLLKLSAGRALRVSFVANLVSTLAGIPVTWLLLLMLQWLIVGVALNVLPETPSTRVQALLPWILGPFTAPWVGASDWSDMWMLVAAAMWLCVPFFFASVWIERRMALRILGPTYVAAAGSWSWQANLLSYVGLMGGLAILLAVSLAWW